MPRGCRARGDVPRGRVVADIWWWSCGRVVVWSCGVVYCVTASTSDREDFLSEAELMLGLDCPFIVKVCVCLCHVVVW